MIRENKDSIVYPFNDRSPDLPINFVAKTFPDRHIVVGDQVDLRSESTWIQIRVEKIIDTDTFEGTIIGFDPVCIAFNGLIPNQHYVQFKEKNVINCRRLKA